MFTEQQNSAIEYRKLDACVVAGPGSGKTTVLVERYRELIETHRFHPRDILAITFTEKAAANLKAKLAALFRHDGDKLRDLESAWVSTIHGFCARLLRENAIAAGLDPAFRVLDAREAEDLRGECLREALDELVAARREDALALIPMLQSPWQTNDLTSVYDAIRAAGKSVAEVRGMPNPAEPMSLTDAARSLAGILDQWPSQRELTAARKAHFAELAGWAQRLAESEDLPFEQQLAAVRECRPNLGRTPESVKAVLEDFRETTLEALKASLVDRHIARFREMIFDVLARFDALYTERKTASASLDFTDLERRAIDLLRCRRKKQFRQIMLDEFQDINEQQAELIRLLRGENVFFAVGDVNQSIYGFRHAQPRIFHAYRDEIANSGKHAVELLHNFRSRPEILRAVEALLNGLEGIDERRLVAGAEFGPKAMPSVEVLRVIDPDKDIAAVREARWIAQRILDLRFDFRDYAVLCRNSESMPTILEAFDAARVPYVSGRRPSFLLSREGRDIRALLAVIANPRDSIALATVLRSPLVGISDEDLLRLRLRASSLTAGLNMAAFEPDGTPRVSRFAQNLKRWRAAHRLIPLDVLIVRMLSDCGVDVEGDNIEAFLRLARSRSGERPLVEFLKELESIEAATNLESELSDEDQGNAVQVMTAHAAKGLEFPVVIIAGMQKGTRGSSDSLTFTTQYGAGMRWKDPAGEDGLEDSWALANGILLDERDKDEGNRLLYVAMTRAAEHLILSYSGSKRRPSSWARRVDEFFGVNDLTPSPEPQVLSFEGFDTTVRITETDPPPASAGGEREALPEIPRIPRPHLQDQYETAVNATSIALFAHCPRKYYIQRLAGWSTGRRGSADFESLPPDDDTDASAAELGSFVHEVLAGKPGGYPAEAVRLAQVFSSSELGKRSGAAARSEREWDFIADLEGTLVRGTVDLWFEENGEFHLVDYKTDDISALQVAARARDYAPQLAIYALAMERALGKRPARGYLHFLRPNVVWEVDLNIDARALIRELREAQDRLQFDLHTGEHCKSCQYYRTLCPGE